MIDITTNLKVRDLRKLNDNELMKMVSELDRIIARYRTGSNIPSTAPKLPPSKTGRGVNWGLFNVLRRNKARIYTILTERRRGIYRISAKDI